MTDDVAGDVSDDVARLRQDYLAAFLRYLPRQDEAALTAGYDIGRGTITNGVSLLDLVRVHHEVLVAVITDRPEDETLEVVSRGADFLTEVLATFDMAQRALLEG